MLTLLTGETAPSLTGLFTLPMQSQNNGKIIVPQHGPVFGGAVPEFTELNELLVPSDDLTHWFAGPWAGQLASKATCLLLTDTGRKIQVMNESIVDVPEEILEAAKAALTAVEDRAVADARAAFPDKICSRENGVLHIGQLLEVVGKWHGDGNILGCEPVLRATIGMPGTRFRPKNTTVSILDDELSLRMNLANICDQDTEPVYKDGFMSYFTRATVHISPSTAETAVLQAEKGLGARTLCSVDIKIDDLA